MGASSSALALSDLALTWSITRGAADLSLIDNDLASDRGLETAMMLSLFLDRRAEDDDVPPSGDDRDRRGWWADAFVLPGGGRYGSRLWLLDRSKLDGDTRLSAREYALEALAWMIEDRVVESIDVETEVTTDSLYLAVTPNRPGRDSVTFRFARAWDHTNTET